MNTPTNPWDISLALESRLQQIATSNGYTTDAGARLTIGQGSVTTVPCLFLVEQEEIVLERIREDGSATVRLPFLIEGHIEGNPAKPNEAAHLLRRDILRAIFGPGIRLETPRVELEYGGYAILPRDPGSKTVVIQVKLQSTHQINVRQP